MLRYTTLAAKSRANPAPGVMTMKGRFERALMGAALGLATVLAHAHEVSVAVAANFAGPLAKIGEGFTSATGHVLKVSSGATGRF
jgi:hypothetical protein